MSFAVAGAGGRGRMFSHWLLENLGRGTVVAVAEPHPRRRQEISEMHGILPENQFETWHEMLDRERLADVLINTTMDQEHLGSACQAMRQGYHMLLEKPIATNLSEAQRIDQVRRETGRIVSVCHSLRYHAAYERVVEVVQSGAVGEVVSLDQLEAVEHIHQSHSFVRGNWGNEARSTFMLLAKSCHDIDVIAMLVGRPCKRVGSFGSLSHFRIENAPPGAPLYCVEGCPVEEACPYHAAKIYGGGGPWSYHGGFEGLTREQALLKLRESPFGVCVYQADNDVVDHQVVAMEFEGGATATFTMTAFTPFGGRYLRIHGTKGYLEAKIDQGTIDLWEFWKGNRHSRLEVPAESGAHGGADDRVMRNLLAAVRRNDPGLVRTGTDESVRTGAVTFAAEIARRERRVVDVEALLSGTAAVAEENRSLVGVRDA
ncbi:MAG TPA: Gfo/Idh/MocA family oxidoreductase [Fimbriimonas sp.]